jgi:hypothetical protein
MLGATTGTKHMNSPILASNILGISATYHPRIGQVKSGHPDRRIGPLDFIRCIPAARLRCLLLPSKGKQASEKMELPMLAYLQIR